MEVTAQIQNQIQRMEHLIEKMEHELRINRNIIERYYLNHGNIVKGEKIELLDDISFGLKPTPENVIVTRTNYNGLGIESDYQKIVKEIKYLRYGKAN